MSNSHTESKAGTLISTTIEPDQVVSNLRDTGAWLLLMNIIEHEEPALEQDKHEAALA